MLNSNTRGHFGLAFWLGRTERVTHVLENGQRFFLVIVEDMRTFLKLSKSKMLRSLCREKQTLVVLSKEMIEARARVPGARTRQDQKFLRLIKGRGGGASSQSSETARQRARLPARQQAPVPEIRRGGSSRDSPRREGHIHPSPARTRPKGGAQTPVTRPTHKVKRERPPA